MRLGVTVLASTLRVLCSRVRRYVMDANSIEFQKPVTQSLFARPSPERLR
jgi:hypothetical protein